jgi:hypothetical protein
VGFIRKKRSHPDEPDAVRAPRHWRRRLFGLIALACTGYAVVRRRRSSPAETPARATPLPSRRAEPVARTEPPVEAAPVAEAAPTEEAAPTPAPAKRPAKKAAPRSPTTNSRPPRKAPAKKAAPKAPPGPDET